MGTNLHVIEPPFFLIWPSDLSNSRFWLLFGKSSGILTGEPSKWSLKKVEKIKKSTKLFFSKNVPNVFEWVQGGSKDVSDTRRALFDDIWPRRTCYNISLRRCLLSVWKAALGIQKIQNSWKFFFFFKIDPTMSYTWSMVVPEMFQTYVRCFLGTFNASRYRRFVQIAPQT